MSETLEAYIARQAATVGRRAQLSSALQPVLGAAAAGGAGLSAWASSMQARVRAHIYHWHCSRTGVAC